MIGIIGAGMSGLFTARALARQGHPVTLLETDPPPPPSVEQAFSDWHRNGVAQFRQPHSARSLIVKTLGERDPELLQALSDAGMVKWPFHLRGVPHDEGGGDDPELVGMLGRRVALEIPLRQTTLAMPGVRLVRTTVKGLLIDAPGHGRRVRGVQTAEGPMEFDCVIDASGRRSKVAEWLMPAGIDLPPQQSNECGIVYYSRNFRFLPGAQVPRGNYPSGPGATMAGVHYTMNRTDANCFTLMLGVTPKQEEFRALRHDDVFMRFVQSLPDTMLWLDPKISAPIWKVEPFAGLTNRHRAFAHNGVPVVRGLYITGDSRFHTNPVHGWGMAFAMQLSYMLADAFAQHAECDARQTQFEAQADAYARNYFEAASAEDAARTELWDDQDFARRGEPGSYRYYLTTVQPAIYKDQSVFQAITRRLHLLDDPRHIMSNQKVLDRAAAIGGSPNQKYSREQLVQMALRAAQVEEADTEGAKA